MSNFSDAMDDARASTESLCNIIKGLEDGRHELRRERDQLRAENGALREALPHMTITSEQMGMPSLKHQEIKNDDFTEELKDDLRHAIADAISGPVRPTTPRTITADELREGQTVAIHQTPTIYAGMVQRVADGGVKLDTHRSKVALDRYSDWGPTIVLLEDAPEPEPESVTAEAPFGELDETDLRAWIEWVNEEVHRLASATLPGDYGTPPRLTVHALNTAPVGSVVTHNATTISFTKLENGRWLSSWDTARWSSGSLINTWLDGTLHLPEDQS